MKYTFLLLLISFQFIHAQETAVKIGTNDDVQSTYASELKAEDLRELLTVIASDEMQGRETGTEGQRKAADFIAGKFADLGLPKVVEEESYFQEIAYITEGWAQNKVRINGENLKNLRQYYAFPEVNSDLELDVSELTFLGYGIDDAKYSDYQGADVKGKVILIYAGEPMSKNGVSRMTGTINKSEWASNFRKKLMVAKKNGVEAVLIIDDKLNENVAENRRFLLTPKMRIGRSEKPEENYANSIFINTETAKNIIGANLKKVIKARKKIVKKLKPQSMPLETQLSIRQRKNVRTLVGSNVLGFIEGSDPVLKDEIVVITAHYDHLGMRGKSSIYNGADDNGTGTSTVLEIADALVQAKKAGKGPRRSVLCMLVSGEEKGLLGSRYYVENPIFPLEQTVVNVNIDMIGRTDDKHEDGNYIYVIGSNRLSTELHEINEAANKKYTQIDLDYTYNAEDDPNRYYYRSDHYNFAERGIPAIFYFSGVHEDYHRTTDTVEKIEFVKMEKIGRLVFHTIWELANRDKRIEVDVKP